MTPAKPSPIESLRTRIAFLDIEASGLMPGSFPIEAAWITSEGAGGVLISPSGVWDESRWDADAEAMHGITVNELKRKGRHPKVAAAGLEAALRGKLVFSDSPDHDAAWADMIHEAGRVERSYRIESVGKLLSHVGLSASRAYRLFDQVRKTHPSRGRASQGVEHLSAVFEAAVKEAGQ